MRTSILTIDPGTIYWGVSVFHGREIITCRVKNLSAKDSPKNRLQEVRKIFLGLCNDYAPDLLIIEKPHDFWQDQSKHLGRTIREVKRLAKKKHIKVIEFSPGTVRKVVCQDENATKVQITEVACRTYPELRGCLGPGRASTANYWGRMADSIGLGICYLKRKEMPKTWASRV